MSQQNPIFNMQSGDRHPFVNMAGDIQAINANSFNKIDSRRVLALSG